MAPKIEDSKSTEPTCISKTIL